MRKNIVDHVNIKKGGLASLVVHIVVPLVTTASIVHSFAG